MRSQRNVKAMGFPARARFESDMIGPQLRFQAEKARYRGESEPSFRLENVKTGEAYTNAEVVLAGAFGGSPVETGPMEE